jgi:hypothetical protein
MNFGDLRSLQAKRGLRPLTQFGSSCRACAWHYSNDEEKDNNDFGNFGVLHSFWLKVPARTWIIQGDSLVEHETLGGLKKSRRF